MNEMYANAELGRVATDSRNFPDSRQVRSPLRFSMRNLLVRFANWYGSSGKQAELIADGRTQGSNLMLLHGQVVVTPSCREETGADTYTM